MDTEPRNRVERLITIRPRDLMNNQGNWRIHPLFQREGLKGILGDVGIADALKVYHSERQGGLTLVDGHLRKADYPDVEWPALFLDINDEEADKLLVMHDTLGGWAQTNPVKMDELIARVRSGNDRMQVALDRIKATVADNAAIARRMLGQDGVDGEDDSSAAFRKGLTEAAGKSVKVVVSVGDDLGTVEKALKAAGLPNRGDALAKVCQFFLDNYDG